MVGAGVCPENFAAFKKQHGKGSAVVVELHCGEEILVDKVQLLRRLPRDVAYTARLLRRVPKPPESAPAGHTVWEEA